MLYQEDIYLDQINKTVKANVNADENYIHDSLRYADNKTILASIEGDKYVVNLLTEGDSEIINNTTGETYTNNLINDYYLDNEVYPNKDNYTIKRRNYHVIEIGIKDSNVTRFNSRFRYKNNIENVKQIIFDLVKFYLHLEQGITVA